MDTARDVGPATVADGTAGQRTSTLQRVARLHSYANSVPLGEAVAAGPSLRSPAAVQRRQPCLRDRSLSGATLIRQLPISTVPHASGSLRKGLGKALHGAQPITDP